MLLWSLLLSRLCSLCKCRCCSLALFLSLPWLQRIFLPDICFAPGNILHPTIFLHQTIFARCASAIAIPVRSFFASLAAIDQKGSETGLIKNMIECHFWTSGTTSAISNENYGFLQFENNFHLHFQIQPFVEIMPLLEVVNKKRGF